MSGNNNELKIFLVDDDEICLNLYLQFLNKLGHSEIECYKSGKTCLENIVQRPDIIFLDYHMGDLNGIDVLHSIKQFDNEITVIFISGQEDIDIAVNALKYGAFDYITKSQITPALLKTTIDRIIAEKGIVNLPSKKTFFDRMKNNLGM
jgi:DNA-binding NtrC family response regulator